MKNLHISEDLALPLDAATQTFAFIARKGAGKTYAAGKLTELLLEAHVQCVILDTVGNWYGLRLSNGGKQPSDFDIPVVGGLRGDIPLQATGGELIADIVVDTGRSLVLDISQFSLGDRKRFATAFGERLWQRKKGESHPSPVMLVIEESQLIIPQNVGKDEARMVGIFEEIIRLGRNYGIGCTMISQRPQSVNKEVLNQTECLFVGQINGSQERDSLKKWISYQGMSPTLVEELPALPQGTMYCWSPQWLSVLQKVRIGQKVTYDASATPRVGEKREARELKPLDLDELKQKMAKTIEEQQANDPKHLKEKIDSLERYIRSERTRYQRELRTMTATATAPQIDEAKLKREIDRAVEAARKPLLRVIDDYEKTLKKVVDIVGPACNRKAFAQTISPPQDIDYQAVLKRPTVLTETHAVPPLAPPSGRYQVRVNGLSVPNGDGPAVKAGARRILAALCQWYPNGITEGQARAQAVMKKSGTYDSYKSALRTNGYIEQRDGLMFATQAGMDFIGADAPATPTNTKEVLNVWSPKLKLGARKMLDVLVGYRGTGISREQLAAEAGFAESGTFDSYLSALRTANLIVSDRGEVKANKETLFL